MSALNKSEWGKKMVDYISESVPAENEVALPATEYDRNYTVRKKRKAILGRFAPVDDIIEDLVQTAKLRRA
jgi:hypothetical protein